MAMEQSILKSTKKILGIMEDDPSFDIDILTHINAAFSVVNQLGVGPTTSLTIEDDTVVWLDLGLPENQLNLVKSYVYLKVRSLFDPPSMSFHVEAMNKQILEHEWRLNVFREEVKAAEEVSP